MTHLEYENLCSELGSGDGHTVENRKSHLTGKVLMCNREYFNVQVGEGWQVWSRRDCTDLDTGIG